MSEFDELVSSGADCLIRLRRLEANRKPTCDSFIEAARSLCGVSNERLAELAVKLTERHSTAIFTRNIARFIGSNNCFSMPVGAKLDKLIRIEASGLEGFD